MKYPLINNLFQYITISKTNHEIISDTLLSSKFYSNFQKIIEINCNCKEQSKVNHRMKFVDDYICKQLSLKSLNEFKLDHVRKMENRDRARNVLKYLFNFGKITISEKEKGYNKICGIVRQLEETEMNEDNIKGNLYVTLYKILFRAPRSDSFFKDIDEKVKHKNFRDVKRKTH
jgi:hypothetical protein